MNIVICVIALVTYFVYADDQIDNLVRLTSDLLGEKFSSLFHYSLIPQTKDGLDQFELSTNKVSNVVNVYISGSNGVSMASSLNHYLKYYLNSEITWGYNDTWKQIKIPNELPEVENKIQKQTIYKHRYYLNVCTVSYTMAWWDEERWLREIDWAALQGYNEILSFTGQEYVFKKTFEHFGLSEDDIFDFFAGPAFLAWGRMANIKHYPGPLDNIYLENQRDIQIKIVERVRKYGMNNILPAFAGFIPDKMKSLYPSMKTLKSSNWCYFNDTYSGVAMIDPSDNMLLEVGKEFLTQQNKVYGSDHLYNCDIFNEMTPPSGDLNYLKNVAKSIIDYMLEVDNKAIWVMQGWLFLNAEYFWTKERVNSFLSGVPNDNMIILDLSSDDKPQWSRLDSYFSKGWVYNVLHNFGGRRSLYGNLGRIVSTLKTSLTTAGSTIVGLGTTMEAIDQNPVVYEFTNELFWYKDPSEIDIKQWIYNYAYRRAGVIPSSGAADLLRDAWDHLYESCYSMNGAYYDVTFNSLSMRPGPSASQDLGWTNPKDLVYVLRQFYRATQIGLTEYPTLGDPHYYDLIDICRQVISNFFVDVIHVTNAAYKRRNINSFKILSQFLLGMLSDLDNMLNTNMNYQLGPFTEAAKKYGFGDNKRVKFFDYNAKLQVSTWAFFNNGILLDYSVKQWAGLVKDYNFKRWELYFRHILDDLNDVKPYDHNYFTEQVWNTVEEPFFMSNTNYTDKPVGDTLNEVGIIISRYVDYKMNRFIVHEDVDYHGFDLFPEKLQSLDIYQMAQLCDLDNDCYGFLSTGYFKKSGGSTSKYDGVQFYEKRIRD